VTDVPLSLAHRLWFAFACFFRVLVDGRFARHVLALTASGTTPSAADTTTSVAATPRPPESRTEIGPSTQRSAPPPAESALASSSESALTLLAIFQREGRLVDFLKQDVDAFPDADIGAAARVVHAGCRRALSAHFDIVPVRKEAEGTTVTVLAAETAAIKLTGDVRGAPPYSGVLRHAGWRVEKTTLPVVVAGHDVAVVCPAEVEL